jgi:glycosyltransferase involved in cell wall biosynthesis
MERSPLSDRLRVLQPDVVQVYGFFDNISRRGIYWARRNGKRVLQLSDGELLRKRSALTRLRKRILVPTLLRQVDGILTIGDCNEEYYRHYGATSDKLFRCPLPVDQGRLSEAVAARADHRRSLRRAHSLPENAVIALVVGKQVPFKSIGDPIRAIAQLRSHGLQDRLFLLLVGDGPERDRLQALASQIAPDAVRFCGFVPMAEFSTHYAAADFLVHPSAADAHPLATSEAVFCGLPVIASDRVGSVGPSDDVQVGRNGLRYRYGDIEALAAAMRTLAADDGLRERMQRESSKIAANRTLAVSVNGFVSAVFAVLGAPLADGVHQ